MLLPHATTWYYLYSCMFLIFCDMELNFRLDTVVIYLLFSAVRRPNTDMGAMYVIFFRELSFGHTLYFYLQDSALLRNLLAITAKTCEDMDLD